MGVVLRRELKIAPQAVAPGPEAVLAGVKIAPDCVKSRQGRARASEALFGAMTAGPAGIRVQLTPREPPFTVESRALSRRTIARHKIPAGELRRGPR
jgi:hypothetical protein